MLCHQDNCAVGLMKKNFLIFSPILLLTSLIIVFHTGLGTVAKAASFSHPGGFHTQAQLDRTRSQILAGASPWSAAYNKLLGEADKALGHTPNPPIEVNTCSPYDTTCDQSANWEIAQNMYHDTEAAYAAALAYAINANLSASQRDQYGRKAVEILKAWAYTNRGITNSQANLDSAVSLNEFIHAAELMWSSQLWTDQDRNTFRQWADTVLYPSCENIAAFAYSEGYTDEYGKGGWPGSINWGDWGIFCSLAIDHLLENQTRLNKDIDHLKEIIDVQIRPDGSMPLELSRGESSGWYTYLRGRGVFTPPTHLI